jgi:hypothetical protein
LELADRLIESAAEVLAIVVPALEEVDAVVRDDVDHPVLLGEAP